MVTTTYYIIKAKLDGVMVYDAGRVVDRDLGGYTVYDDSGVARFVPSWRVFMEADAAWSYLLGRLRRDAIGKLDAARTSLRKYNVMRAKAAVVGVSAPALDGEQRP